MFVWPFTSSYLYRNKDNQLIPVSSPEEISYLPCVDVHRPGEVLGFRTPLLPPIPVPDPLNPPEEWTTDPPTTKEAYVTFLADIVEPYYYYNIRLQLFSLKHDPSTRDLSRDYIVLTTPHIPPILEETLRSEGALIARRPLLRDFPGQVDLSSTHPYKDQFSKLHILNFTQYDRVMYLDSDQMLNTDLKGIWEDENAVLESGELAGCADMGFEHETPAEDGERFNAGFWIVKPDGGVFEEVVHFGRSDGWSAHWDMEQVYTHDLLEMSD
jgi:alpha-N-acetylglucosamine transferase